MLKSTIHRDGEDYAVEIEYAVIPASRGARGPYGEQLEPDYAAVVEILNVRLDGELNSIKDLTADEIERFEEQVAKHEKRKGKI